MLNDPANKTASDLLTINSEFHGGAPILKRHTISNVTVLASLSHLKDVSVGKVRDKVIEFSPLTLKR